MSIRSDKWFHYVLILILMCAPLRLYATQGMMQQHCHEADSTTQQASVMSSEKAADYPSDTSVSSDDNAMSHHCCCCDKNSCNDDCGVSHLISLLPTASYMPAFTAVAKSEGITFQPITRALEPLSRPPLHRS